MNDVCLTQEGGTIIHAARVRHLCALYFAILYVLSCVNLFAHDLHTEPVGSHIIQIRFNQAIGMLQRFGSDVRGALNLRRAQITQDSIALDMYIDNLEAMSRESGILIKSHPEIVERFYTMVKGIEADYQHSTTLYREQVDMIKQKITGFDIWLEVYVEEHALTSDELCSLRLFEETNMILCDFIFGDVSRFTAQGFIAKTSSLFAKHPVESTLVTSVAGAGVVVGGWFGLKALAHSLSQSNNTNANALENMRKGEKELVEKHASSFLNSLREDTVFSDEASSRDGVGVQSKINGMSSTQLKNSLMKIRTALKNSPLANHGHAFMKYILSRNAVGASLSSERVHALAQLLEKNEDDSWQEKDSGEMKMLLAVFARGMYNNQRVSDEKEGGDR